MIPREEINWMTANGQFDGELIKIEIIQGGVSLGMASILLADWPSLGLVDYLEVNSKGTLCSEFIYCDAYTVKQKANMATLVEAFLAAKGGK